MVPVGEGWRLPCQEGNMVVQVDGQGEGTSPGGFWAFQAKGGLQESGLVCAVYVRTARGSWLVWRQLGEEMGRSGWA